MNELIPRPLIDGDSKTFWEGLQDHKLLIQQCESCLEYIFYPRSICPKCFSEQIKWRESEGTGHIYSYTVVHNAFNVFKDQIPFIVAIVELDEGVRMMTRILADQSQVSIGKHVKINYEKIDSDLTLPYFNLN